MAERPRDLLDTANWECAPSTPGAISGPGDLDSARLEWLPAQVPGTASGACRAAGRRDALIRDYDGEEWWYRCRVSPTADRAWPRDALLSCDGLATLAGVYWNGRLVGRSEDQYLPFTAELELRQGENELCLRFESLTEHLAQRRPRPRWKTYLVSDQNLRWYRTALLGRMPGLAAPPPAVGPVRPVRLLPSDEPVVVSAHLVAEAVGDRGVIEARATIREGSLPGALAGAMLRCGAVVEPVQLVEGPDSRSVEISAGLELDHVERWWPRSHGPQPLYEVTLECESGPLLLGRVGFRTVSLERTGGRFSVVVNDVEVFCRGAAWFPPDCVTMAASDGDLVAAVRDATEANMNMLRVPAVSGYEEERFYSACDEAGILVWQECPFAFMDPPEDERFEELVVAELRAALVRIASHPSLAVVCGSQQTEEIPAMNGLDPSRYVQPLIHKIVPGLCAELCPQSVYVPSEPSGGELPFQMNAGVSQYFGVGGYLRPLSDVRRASVRFAAECLALATPPCPETVEELGGAHLAGHDPSWKLGVHHDAGRSWDMEDVRDFYSRELFGTDPLLMRYTDPERALEIGRATNAELVSAVFGEWRRPGSSCDGGLVLGLRDLRLGAGFGLVDAKGRRKATWFAARRAFAPITLLISDEGLNGLVCHVVNDTGVRLSASLTLELYSRGSLRVEQATTPVDVAPRSSHSVDASSLLGGFRDASYAFRFAPPAHDLVVAVLEDSDGKTICGAVHLPLGQARALEESVGLKAVARREGVGWLLEVSADRFAQWTHLALEGFTPDDDWFHVVPGRPHTVSLRCVDPWRVPVGEVRAVNSIRAGVIDVDQL